MKNIDQTRLSVKNNISEGDAKNPQSLIDELFDKQCIFFIVTNRKSEKNQREKIQ